MRQGEHKDRYGGNDLQGAYNWIERVLMPEKKRKNPDKKTMKEIKNIPKGRAKWKD